MNEVGRWGMYIVSRDLFLVTFLVRWVVIVTLETEILMKF